MELVEGLSTDDIGARTLRSIVLSSLKGSIHSCAPILPTLQLYLTHPQ